MYLNKIYTYVNNKATEFWLANRELILDYISKNFEKFFFSTNHKDIGLYIFYFL